RYVSHRNFQIRRNILFNFLLRCLSQATLLQNQPTQTKNKHQKKKKKIKSMKNSKKQFGRAETICMKVAIFFFLQVSFMFIIRRSSIPSSPQIQEHTRWRRLKLRSSSSSSKSLLSLRHDDHLDHRKWSLKLKSLSPPPIPMELTIQHEHLKNPITCDRSNRLYDWCHLRLSTVLDPSTATFFTSSVSPKALPMITEKVKPYPRKRDRAIMSKIKEITLTTSPSPKCQVHHNTPAVVFSTGGFTGNFFHDFNDGFIPLFITTNTFFPNQDVTLVIADYNEWWYEKYEAILTRFTKQQIINLDNQTATHCFPSVAAGLITHGPMTIKPNQGPNKKTMLDFRALLEAGYRRCPAWPAPKVKGRPRLVVVSRAGLVGRVILNQEAVIRAAQEEGFEVFVFEPTPDTYLCQIYRLINSSHVVVGVHGAALTHSLFLPPKQTLIQIVPLGNDWLAQTYFGSLARELKLEYFEYNLKPGESTLSEKYGFDHMVVKDAMNVASKNWSALHNIYLKSQDVRLDINRFRGCLRRAYSKAKRLMQEQGLRVRRRNHKIKTYVKPILHN
ncbi:hypothetical protein V2J09_013766, partial [Rumex salicifolius]